MSARPRIRLPENSVSLASSLLVAFCLIALVWCLFFVGLGSHELSASHEARAAQNALSIVNESCWLLPHLLDGHAEMQKPPLYYWLVACAAWLRGGTVDAIAVRLPSALAAVAACLAMLVLGRLTGRTLAGVVAAVALATMVHFTHLAQVGRIDMPLCACLSWALCGFYLGQHSSQGGWRWYLLAYVALAVGVLLKGPIALVLPGAAILVHRFLEGFLLRRYASAMDGLQAKTIVSPSLWKSAVWGMPLVLVLTIPWFIVAYLQTDGEFVRVFVWYHNVERGFGGDGPLATHPWWFYVARLATDLLPWGLLLPLLVWYFWHKRLWKLDAPARFGLAWFLGMTLVLSFMRFKRADYLLPAYPGMALFIGCTLEQAYAAFNRPRIWRVGLVLLLVTFTIGWQAYRRDSGQGDRHQRLFAEAICQSVPTRVPIIFFRIEAHQLAFHVGRRYNTVLEWENLDTWAGSGKAFYVVMTPECVRQLPIYVHQGRLTSVLESHDLVTDGQATERPFALLRGVRADSWAER
jgi:4-amino-4-deoxy-L-arabinose transferase-like glycosyltransferase